MFAGHFATGLAAKSVAPALSLGTLLLACQLLDLLWPSFLLLGWELVQIDPDARGSDALLFEHYPFSHSLLAAIGWGVALGAVVFAMCRRRSGAVDDRARAAAVAAVVVALLVVGHWLLDAIVHAPDLPLAPAGTARIGFGLWDAPLLALVVELAMLAIGAALYLRATEPRDRIGRWAPIALFAALAAIQLANTRSEPPPSVAAVAWVGQAQWLFVLWGYWIDRHRTPRGAGTAAALREAGRPASGPTGT